MRFSLDVLRVHGLGTSVVPADTDAGLVLTDDPPARAVSETTDADVLDPLAAGVELHSFTNASGTAYNVWLLTW